MVQSGHYKVCMLCKVKGESLKKCLLRLLPTETSNGAKHLNRFHKEELAAMERANKNKVQSQQVKRVCCPSNILMVYLTLC